MLVKQGPLLKFHKSVSKTVSMQLKAAHITYAAHATMTQHNDHPFILLVQCIWLHKFMFSPTSISLSSSNLLPSDWQLPCTPSLSNGESSAAHSDRVLGGHPGAGLHPAAEPRQVSPRSPGAVGHPRLDGEAAAGERAAG